MLERVADRAAGRERAAGELRRRSVLLGGLSMAAGTALPGCSAPRPAPGPAPAPVHYSAMPAAIEAYVGGGSAAFDAIRAVLVSVGGSLVVEHYRRGFDATSHLHVWSMTKSVVATLVGAAVADGLIGLDATLAELLPDEPGARSSPAAAATLRDLMSMTAGFASDPPQAPTEAIPRGGDLVALLLSLPPASPPGSAFLYSNVSAHLVSAALHAALGRAGRPRNVLAYARERLFDPLGIVTRPAYEGDGRNSAADDRAFRRSGFAWDADSRGIHLGAFGLRLTAPDVVRLGELHRLSGVWQGSPVFGDDWVARVTTPTATYPTYGLLWWLRAFGGRPAYSAEGSAGQLLVVVPETRTVVVVLSADDADLPISETEVLYPLVDDVLLR